MYAEMPASYCVITNFKILLYGFVVCKVFEFLYRSHIILDNLLCDKQTYLSNDISIS